MAYFNITWYASFLVREMGFEGLFLFNDNEDFRYRIALSFSSAFTVLMNIFVIYGSRRCWLLCTYIICNNTIHTVCYVRLSDAANSFNVCIFIPPTLNYIRTKERTND